MRTVLRNNEGNRTRFTAVFERAGFNGNPEWAGGRGTLLFTNVRFESNGKFASDHVWLKAGKWSDKLGLKPGMKIALAARVTAYRKGFNREELDYRLSFPTQAQVLEDESNVVTEQKE